MKKSLTPSGDKKRPVGRPRLDPTGKQTTYGVKLTPTEAKRLRDIAGSVNAGVRQAVAELLAKS